MDEEDELQARLEEAPEASRDIRDLDCIFCGDPATSWVDQNEVVIPFSEEYEGKMAPMCEGCKGDIAEVNERMGCIHCAVGNFCPEHDLDWLEGMLDDDGYDEPEE